MQAYRRSVTFRDAEEDETMNNSSMAASSIMQRTLSTSYRQSWHPNWMNSNEWIGNMSLPEELTVDLSDDEDEKYDRQSRKIDPAAMEAQRLTMAEWEQSELRDKWYPLLCNVARSVTQATPWGDQTITKDVRQGILLAVLKRFLDHSADREIMALQTKELLNTIKEEDPTLEIQLSLVAYTNGQAWEGADRYLQPSNWNDQADLKAFREETELLVQDRLHQINSDVSKAEARLTDAIDQWTDVHSHSACFGGGLHDVVPFDERTTTTKNGRVMADEKMSSDAPPMNSGTARPTHAHNQIHFNLHSISVTSVNPGTGKKAHLPSNALISIAYYHGGSREEECQLKGRARAVNDGKLQWNGSGVSFRIPSKSLQGDPSRFENIDRCYIVVTIEEARVCGIFGGGHLAQITIPVSCMYKQISELHSQDRVKLVEQRKANGDPREVGIHFCHDQFTDADSGISVKVSVSMECCAEIHNRTPPRVDAIREMARLKMRVSETRENVWAIDHHAKIVELADILGELTDAENYALQLYADRFFVHKELLQVLCLVAFATKGNFTDFETREGMADACEALAQIKTQLKTKQCQEICDKGLGLAMRQCLERVLAIEDVSKDPSNGQSLMDTCLHILEMMDVREEIVNTLVEERAIEYGEYVARKLTKLLLYIPASGRADSRMSMLLELEQKENSDSLLAKARAFYEILDNAFFVLTNMITFAVETHDERIQNLACRRTNIILEKLFTPMTRAITAFFGELAKVGNADPLGDAFGVITLLYERVMEYISVIDEIPALDVNCLRLVQPFNSFLPSWFTMCQIKVPHWIKSIVKAEPLEPIAPGKIFCNSAPADAKNLMDAIFAIFNKVIDWVDPEMTHMYVTNFSKLVLEFVECFSDALVEKAMESDVPEQWMVAMCSLTKFETTVQIFWQDKVFNGICRSFGDEEGLMLYQCQSLRASSMSHISTKKDDLSGFIGINMRGAALAFLEEAAEEADDPNISKEELNRIFSEVVTACVRNEMALIANNMDKVTAPTVLIQAARGLHGSFADFALAQSGTSHTGDFRTRMLDALAAIEASLKEFNNFDHIPPDILFDLSHKSRALVHLVSQATPDIIESLDGKKGIEISDAEKSRLIAVLQQRVNDKVALKYLKNSGNLPTNGTKSKFVDNFFSRKK